jgi:hypothetical protein
VGEEAVALEGGGGGPRVHREGQPPRQLDRHGLSLLPPTTTAAAAAAFPLFSRCFVWVEGKRELL